MELFISLRRIVVCSLLALSASACSALPGSSSDTPAEQAFQYFEELSKGSRVGYESAASISVGSAREYASYFSEYIQAIEFARSDGQNFEQSPLETASIDESGRIIMESIDSRITYSDFEFVQGKLIDFKVEGRLLSGNLRSNIRISFCRTYDDKCDSPGSFDVDVLHAYIGSSGNLNVTYSARQGEKFQQTVRTKNGNGNLPKHLILTSAGDEVKVTGAVETFARGATRINFVQFGPLNGGGEYTIRFKFNSWLLEDTYLGSFLG